jgi:hypothetical protein
MPSQLPTTGDEYRSFVADANNTDIVHDAEQWQKLLNTPGNPLSAIDPSVLEAFTATLIFKEGGLGHAEYDTLIDKVTYRQFELIWSCFGVSMLYFEGTRDFYCCGHRHCCGKQGSWCSSVC